MLGQTIQTLRKQKGYSQQTLAQQLHVVRQTVSKWEKGLSVPDAQMLARIAELLEVPVEELLTGQPCQTQTGTDLQAVAQQLAIFNEQLANQSRRRSRIFKAVLVGLAAVLALTLLFSAAAILVLPARHTGGVTTTTTLQCTLDGQTYLYQITYDEQYRIVEAGGDGWIADHVLCEQYDDANLLIAQIQDYFTDRGGVCQITSGP